VTSDRRIVITEEGALDVRGEDAAQGVLVSTLDASGYVSPWPLATLVETVEIDGGEVQVLKAIREVVQAAPAPAPAPAHTRSTNSPLVEYWRGKVEAEHEQVLEAQEAATRAQEEALGEVWLSLPEGGDLIGRGHDEISVLETVSGYVGGGCAGALAGGLGGVLIVCYPEWAGIWYRSLGLIILGQLLGACVQAAARVRRTWRFWAPIKGAEGKVQVRRVAKGGGLDVWAERRGRKAWVPAGEFCWLHEEGPDEEDSPDEE